MAFSITVHLSASNQLCFVHEWASIWGKAHAATLPNSC